jgi:hypothetical protein
VIDYDDAGACVSGGHHARGTCAKNKGLDMHAPVGGLKFEPVQGAGAVMSCFGQMKTTGAGPNRRYF